MFPDSTGPQSWDVVAAELRAYREEQKQKWGDLDHALIGRYLAGEVNPEERARVEAALNDHPDLRILTEVVSDVLNTSPPIEVEPEAPAILTFSPARAKKNRLQRSRRLFALAAAACLLLGLGIALNRQVTLPERAGLDNNTTLTANGKDRMAGEAGRKEADLVAMVDDAVSKNDFETAGKALFPPRLMVRSGVGGTATDKRNERPQPQPSKQAVLRLTERVLDVNPPSDSEDRVGKMSAPLVAIAPPAPAGRGSGAMKQETRDWILRNALGHLVDGVRQNDDPELQKRSARAIARMGPYAGPAVPGLVQILEHPACREQQEAVVTTFKQLGPNARDAAPAIEKLVHDKQCCKEVKEQAQEALRKVHMPRWIGVRDPDGVLDAKARERINQRIHDLSERHHVHIVAEAVRCLPEKEHTTYFAYKADEKDKKASFLSDVARKGSRAAAGDRAVYLFICMDPPAVRVIRGPEAEGKAGAGWSVDAAQEHIEKSLENPDRGLEDVLKMIERADIPK